MDAEESNLESAIDRIFISASDLKKKLEAIQSDAVGGSCDISPEYLKTQQVKDLERENTELRKALEDHQYGLEFIMTKYRSQVIELMRLNSAGDNAVQSQTHVQQSREQIQYPNMNQPPSNQRQRIKRNSSLD